MAAIERIPAVCMPVVTHLGRSNSVADGERVQLTRRALAIMVKSW